MNRLRRDAVSTLEISGVNLDPVELPAHLLFFDGDRYFHLIRHNRQRLAVVRQPNLALDAAAAFFDIDRHGFDGRQTPHFFRRPLHRNISGCADRLARHGNPRAGLPEIRTLTGNVRLTTGSRRR